MASSEVQPRLYFGYGSNLSLAQMASRCPASKYHSFGLLKNHKWVIGPRGYANVVPTPVLSEDVVYGMLYTLSPADERALDRAEGVPYAYVKQMHTVQLLGLDAGKTVEALVYVDVARLGNGVCQEEYVARMNRGIKDAVEKGMPKAYVEGMMRKWVRDEEVNDDWEMVDPFHPENMKNGESEGA